MFILQRRHISYCISIHFLVGMNMHKALKRNHECVKGEICRPLQVNIKQTKKEDYARERDTHTSRLLFNQYAL